MRWRRIARRHRVEVRARFHVAGEPDLHPFDLPSALDESGVALDLQHQRVDGPTLAAISENDVIRQRRTRLRRRVGQGAREGGRAVQNLLLDNARGRDGSARPREEVAKVADGRSTCVGPSELQAPAPPGWESDLGFAGKSMVTRPPRKSSDDPSGTRDFS